MFDLEKQIERLIDLKRGDDHGELYLLEGGHFSHPVDFDAFSIAQAKERAQGYMGFQTTPEQLADDVRFLMEHADAIAALFYRPDNYIQGDEIMFCVQALMERTFLMAVLRRNRESQGAIITVLHCCYRFMDSPLLQDSILFAMEDEGESALVFGDQRHDMLRFFCAVNDSLFQKQLDEPHFCLRVNNQMRLIRALFAYADKKFRKTDEPDRGDYEAAFEKIYNGATSEITRQIQLNLMLQMPEFILQKIFWEEQVRQYRYALQCASQVEYLYQDIDRPGLPRLAGYLDIASKKSVSYLKYVINSKHMVDVRYWLLTLRRYAWNRREPFDAIGTLERLLESHGVRLDSMPEEFLSIASDLVPRAKELLERIVSEKQDWQRGEHTEEMRLCGQAFEIEMLYAAISLKLHAQYEKTDIWRFLRRLRYTFVYDQCVVFVVAEEEGTQASAYKFPLVAEWRMVPELERFVQSIYEGSVDSEYSAFGQGALTALIKKQKP